MTLAQWYAAMWAGWDFPSRILAGGTLLACLLLGWHVVARLIQ
jgi:hypothetical protein